MQFALQFFFQEFSCQTLGAGGNLLWCSCANHFTTTVATFRSHVDDVVGTLNNIHVMFDDEDGMATFYEGVKGLQQTINVVEMQTRGGFVEDKEGGGLTLLSNEVGELDALVFTTRECRRVLPQFDVSQAHVFEGFQTSDDSLGHSCKTIVHIFSCLDSAHRECRA